ncbi:MAG: GAF domain-containing protein [Anaerolineae bacterium]|nr:GAF domain-containing protein [Anaerolineae bacterium]
MNPANILRLQFDYQSPIKNIRARGLIATVASTLILTIAYAGMRIINLALAGEPLPPPIILLLFSIPLILIIYVAVQRGHLEMASLVTMFILFMLTGIMGLNENGNSRLSVIVLIIAGGTLFGTKGAIISMFVAFTTSVIGIVNPVFADQNLTDIEYILIMAAVILGSGFLMMTFVTSLQSTATRANDVIHNANIALSGKTINRTFNSDVELIQALLADIEDSMHFDIVQAYLTENGFIYRHVTRTASETLNQVTNLNLKETSIGLAIQTLQPMIVNRSDPYARRAHHSPGIQTNISLPLIFEDQLLGVLDIQVRQTNAIDSATSGILQLVASELALKIGSWRLTTVLQAEVKEQEETVQRLRTQPNASRQMPSRPLSKLGSDLVGDSLIGFDLVKHDWSAKPNHELTPEIQAALNRNDLHIETDAETQEQTVSLPIRIRDMSVGAISFSLPADLMISQSQMDLMRDITQRLSMAIENRMLFEQSETIARREVVANEVGQMLLGTTNIDTVLALAAEQFNNTLGAVQTRIRIQPQAMAFKPITPTDVSTQQDSHNHAEELA